jgi:hypothetical protein
MSVRRPAQNNAAPNKIILIKLHMGVFFENMPRKFTLHYNLTKPAGTSYEAHFSFVTYLFHFFLERKMFQTKFFLENQKKNFFRFF